MCYVSFGKEALHITIRNQYPGLALIPPVYFNHGTTYCIAPSQKANTGDTIEASFGIDAEQRNEGALLYKLEMKNVTKIEHQPNMNPSCIDDIAPNVYLSVDWNIKDGQHQFRVYLVESNAGFILDEDVLWALYKKCDDVCDEPCGANSVIWLTHGGAVIKTRFDIIYGSDYKLDIMIYKGAWKYNMRLADHIYSST
jgi:hypothetical protein